MGELKQDQRELLRRMAERLADPLGLPIWLKDDLAALLDMLVDREWQLDEDRFYRWHNQDGRCGECHRKGYVQPDPRHTWTPDQWRAAVRARYGMEE